MHPFQPCLPTRHHRKQLPWQLQHCCRRSLDRHLGQAMQIMLFVSAGHQVLTGTCTSPLYLRTVWLCTCKTLVLSDTLKKLPAAMSAMASMRMNTSDRVKSDLMGLQITANMEDPLCLHPVRSVLAQAGHCTHGGGFDLSALLCCNLLLFRASVLISCTVTAAVIITAYTTSTAIMLGQD